MNFIRFESANEKERLRNEIRAAREQLLEKAKKESERRTELQRQKELKGETNWIHPSVAQKFENEVRKSKKKSSKKKSHRKKEKKSKKSKKSHKRKHGSSESDESGEESSSDSSGHIKRKKKSKKLEKEISSESSESDSKCVSKKLDSEWIEKTLESANNELKPQDLRRDNWMMDSSGFSLQTFGRARNEETKILSKSKIDSYDPAKSSLELNPYWKTTGTGLPTFQKPKNDSDEDEDKHESLKKRYKQHAAEITQISTQKKWKKSRETMESIEAKSYKKSTKDIEENCIKKGYQSDSSSSSTSSSSSSSSKRNNMHKLKDNGSQVFLTDQQMNELGAKIVKAEILGNTEMANELKAKLDKARKDRAIIRERPREEKRIDKSKQEEHVLLFHTDERGQCRPLQRAKKTFDERDLYGGRSARRKQTKRSETHVDGERVRYFADDDKYDIKQMFEREKFTSSSDSNLQFANIASKHKNPTDDLDDIFVDKVRTNITDSEMDRKAVKHAIQAHEKLTKQLENCDKCFDSNKMDKKLLVSVGNRAYLSLPWHCGLQPGHCLIAPTQHVSCCTQLDEDAWEEIENLRKALTRMFAAQRKDVVFIEIANKLHRRPHVTIHCIPISFEKSEMLPFYFKKAIEESEQEWCVNKQLVRLRADKGLRNSIPKGLPYFWVHFGTDSGFAHVIEDQDRFPPNFAFEIIGGMLNLEPNKWRKPQKEQNAIAKVNQFADWWKKYDIT